MTSSRKTNPLWFGVGYFANVSAKKALWGLVSMVQSAPGECADAIGRAMVGGGPAASPQQRH